MSVVFDLISHLAPPIALIDHLEQMAERQPLPGSVVNYLKIWRTIRAGDPDPVVDRWAGDGDKWPKTAAKT